MLRAVSDTIAPEVGRSGGGSPSVRAARMRLDASDERGSRSSGGSNSSLGIDVTPEQSPHVAMQSVRRLSPWDAVVIRTMQLLSASERRARASEAAASDGAPNRPSLDRRSGRSVPSLPDLLALPRAVEPRAEEPRIRSTAAPSAVAAALARGGGGGGGGGGPPLPPNEVSAALRAGDGLPPDVQGRLPHFCVPAVPPPSPPSASSTGAATAAAVRIAALPPCVICLDVMAPGEAACRLPCLHTYHETCIAKWFAHHRTCPVDAMDVATLLEAAPL